VPPQRPAFQVETFEYVEAGPGLALLRLAGTWRAGDPPGGAELVVVSAGERVTLAPLPAPPAGDGDPLWRAAYSAPPDLLHAAFELDPPAGRPIPLPAPVEHGAAEADDAEDAEEAVDEPQAAAPRRRFGRRREQPRPASTDALDAVREELRGAVGKAAELVERIAGYEEDRTSFTEELEGVRRTLALELEAVREQLQATQRELDAANRHLDTMYEAHTLELGSARNQRDSANERSARLEQALRDARAEIDALRDQLDDREALIERARADAGRASRESAEMEAAVARLHDAIAARAREAAASPRRRFARDPQELERAREELRRGAERIAALERQAEALREAIHSQLPPSLQPSPLQEALPLDP
jgi:predicted  nucleic acid-binding Zn-ribbon protein